MRTYDHSCYDEVHKLENGEQTVIFSCCLRDASISCTACGGDALDHVGTTAKCLTSADVFSHEHAEVVRQVRYILRWAADGW